MIFILHRSSAKFLRYQQQAEQFVCEFHIWKKLIENRIVSVFNSRRSAEHLGEIFIAEN
jgi:hypothetical protein